MSLPSGTQIGPYEIVAPLGAGGMGEVYRARDPRIGREVAIKVLPAAFASDADRLRRFEQEVQAIGALNHPNILAIYDVGRHDGSPYIVSELLEGETLRERLGGAALAARKAIEYAQQVARGLAAAHAKGIVHRDLKPENLFVTKDGRVKILDFGLAKLTYAEVEGTGSRAPTQDAGTDPGVVLGTMGYMSPEQVKGRPADHRSDLFTFGAILYEMLAGRRAFRGESAVETMHAILKDEPPDLSLTDQRISPAIERIIRRCLEKSPEERFQSASDLGFALEALSHQSVPNAVSPALAPTQWKRRFLPAVVGLALVASYAAVFLIGQRASKAPPGPAFYRRVTFRRGFIGRARLALDGQTIVYGAAWEGAPTELFSTRQGSTESRPLGLVRRDILSISASGEMALLSVPRVGVFTVGTLSRAPLAGGAPREILEGVAAADWSPDGSDLAISHVVNGRWRVEYPIGKVLYEGGAFVPQLCVSPKGDPIAFTEWQPGQRTTVNVVDRNGSKKTLGGEWVEGAGLAWSPAGDEIWFSLSDGRSPPAIRAVNLAGQVRLIARAPAALILHDIRRDGTVLASQHIWKARLMSLAPGETQERDYSWLDWSIAAGLSADGKTLLFSEGREGGGPQGSVYLRKIDESTPIRLGDGFAQSLSPDGKWAISIHRVQPRQLHILPTGAGEAKTLQGGNITYLSAGWFPDGQRVLISGREDGHQTRIYVQDLSGGAPRPVTPEGITGGAVSPDGKMVAATGAGSKLLLYAVEGGEPRSGPDLAPGDALMRWSGDGQSVFLRTAGSVPARIFRLHLASGRRELLREILPGDSTGLLLISPLLIGADGKSYAYTYQQHFSDLFLMEGLR